MAITQKALDNELRARMAQIAIDAYQAAGFEVMQTAGGTWFVPCLDMNGDEAWFKLSAIVPKNASEEDGTDGYALAEAYQITVAKAEARKEVAAKKAAEAQAKREAKANAKNKE